MTQYCAQQRQRPVWQGDITIFGAFAMADMNHHPRAVDVGDLKMGSFLQAQPAGVDGRETDPVAQESDAAENLAHLLTAEDDRAAFSRGAGRTMVKIVHSL